LTLSRHGVVHHYLFSITPVPSKGDGMLGVVLLLRDVTRLKELDRLKSEFVMMASHELRTPLTSIGMSVDLLLENVSERLDERHRQLLVAAHEEVQRLKRLITDLLDLSKIEAGKIDMDFEPVPLEELFERVMGVFRSQAEDAGVSISQQLREGLPEVRADAGKITWVLTNLVSNALRYVAKGGSICLSAERVGSHVHICVSDDGPGIPREYQSKIFEKFVRIGGNRDVEGSGLGLAICKEIVRAHRGTIWVDSPTGRGSTFTFTLPVVA
jgi:NtrC-family two-component system sensor histidine kinase KinB